MSVTRWLSLGGLRRKALCLALGSLLSCGAWAVSGPGLKAPGSISYDAEGVPTIIAANDRDLAWLLGYAHARDRFFQMDFSRRGASGTVAELVGDAALANDVQTRTLGLRRAALESWMKAPEELREILKGYSEGVNEWLRTNPLPPEYGALELTRAEPWSPVDTLVIGKALAFQLSFDLDIDFTLRLGAYQAAGAAGGFNGAALFFEDTHRIQPTDGRVSIPGFLTSIGGAGAGDAAKSAAAVDQVDPVVMQLAAAYREKVENHPLISPSLRFREDRGASNWWMVSGEHTASGKAMLANDPHLALDTPAVWEEVHLYSSDPRHPEPLDVTGTAVPGTPMAILGCTVKFCWGLTTNPMDVTDVYQERIRVNTYGLPTHTLHSGVAEPVYWVFQSYFSNRIGDGVLNNVAAATSIGYTNGGITVIVPRRNNGPILQIDAANQTALSVAYTGFSGTQELEAFRRINRARGLEEFRAALSYFDVGSQNFAYTDQDGNIAYFVTAEAPIRKDLQAGGPDGGIPPFLIRTGDGSRNHDWAPLTNPQVNQAVPFEVLPLAEMPFAINPASGYLANANNDPIGVTLDNNPLNQLRPGGGLYYLDIAYSDFRQGRIDRLLNQRIQSGQKIDPAYLQQMQANNQPLDAELLVGLLKAQTGTLLGAPRPGLATAVGTLLADSTVRQAYIRVAEQWDFSTPTGIPQGFDPGDDPNNLPQPSVEERVNASAATLYAVWRSRLIANTVDATLAAKGLGSNRPGSEESVRALIKLLRDYPTRNGVGTSGLDFFTAAAPSGLSNPLDRRDFIVLKSLREALDLLAGDSFKAAFGNSTNIDDYAWGRLHRIVFDHPLGGPFNLPGANPYGFSNLSAELPGVARPGGYEVVDASGHNVRASTVNGFMFGSGAARRFVGDMTSPIDARQIIPGGQSGVLGSPTYASQLGRWLTNRYKPLVIGRDAALQGEVSRLEFTP